MELSIFSYSLTGRSRHSPVSSAHPMRLNPSMLRSLERQKSGHSMASVSAHTRARCDREPVAHATWDGRFANIMPIKGEGFRIYVRI